MAPCLESKIDWLFTLKSSFMACSSSHHQFLLLSLFLLLLLLLIIVSPSTSQQQTTISSKSLLLPLKKDPSTLQHLTQILQRTPFVPINLTLDLGGEFLWVDCGGYVSSSYTPAHCNSHQCILSKSTNCIEECTYSSHNPAPGCYNHTCGLLPDNTVIGGVGSTGQLGSDIISIPNSQLGSSVSVRNLLFICAKTYLLDSLADGVTGMAGLGRTGISLPSQFSSALRLKRKFLICLSSSSNSKGFVAFGDGIDVQMQRSDLFVSYTPLFINPVSTASSYFGNQSSSDYFIGVKSIKVNGKLVNKFDKNLLSIDSSSGFGGTKISTVQKYSTLAASIYDAVLDAFVKEFQGIPIVKPVPPFGLCYDSSMIQSGLGGPVVPEIELVLEGKSKPVWRILGGNSMVRVKEDVWCLGFVSIGPTPRTSIVIGAHFVEENLLQFDLKHSKLGFSNSLLLQKTSCSNFTSI